MAQIGYNAEVYPNPAFEEIEVYLNFKLKELKTAELIDINGKVLDKINLRQFDSDSNIFGIGIESYPLGLNLIKFKLKSGHSFTSKFVKL